MQPCNELIELYSNDPRAKFYNLDVVKTMFLTTDIDWAPDFATEDLFQTVTQRGFKITAFATHKSELLAQKNSLIEIGLHPDNTRPDKEFVFANKLNDLKNIYPESVGLRCHRNFFGNNISDLAVKAGLKYDVSTLQWLQPFCSAFIDYNKLIRASYFWEDGIHCDTRTAFEISKVRLDTPGMKIFNVHPILIYLNAPNDDYRREVTKVYKDLTQAKYSDLKEKIYKGYGIKTFYVDLLEHFKNLGLETLHMKDII